MTWQEKMKLEPTPILGDCDCEPKDIEYDNSRIMVLNQHIQSMIDEKMILFGNYCLAREGKIFANASVGKDSKPDAPFEIQSITKLFTAVAILKLAEDSILYLEQPVHHWISEFDKKDFKKITILHCLTHTSGLVGLMGTHGEEDVDWQEMVDSNHVESTWIPAIIKAGLRRKPGEEWSYSMAGFLVLGEIIKRASGIKAEDFIRETILLPCEMTQCYWTSDLEGMPGTATGLVCTAKELVQFGQMILDGGSYKGKRIIGRKALEYLWTDMIKGELRDYCWDHPGNPVAYGAGAPIWKSEYDQQQLVSDHVLYHEGKGAGMLIIDREEQMVAVYHTKFCNEDDWFWEAVKGTASIIWSGIK